MGGLLAWLVRLGAGGIVDRAMTVLEKRTDAMTDREKIRADLTAEYFRQVVEETRIMADYNKAKLSFPLALWWAAVIFDSVFGFSWSVADLPTSQMQAWAGNMIQWVFYVGSGVAGLKAISR